MRGRRSKYNPQVRKKICEGILKGMGYTRACREIGICQSTAYRWLLKYADLKKAVDGAFAAVEKRQKKEMRESIKRLEKLVKKYSKPLLGDEVVMITDKKYIQKLKAENNEPEKAMM